MSATRGAVATGQPDAAAAAAEVLRAGGNAIDAGIAAMACACVAEPVLASLAGGAFSMLVPPDGPPRVVDSFVATPARARPLDELEFVSLAADFGDDQQPFHVGRGTCAVPGIIDGLFTLHRVGGTLPMSELLGFAARLAANGVEMRDFDVEVLRVCRAIVQFSPDLAALYASAEQADATPDGDPAPDVTVTLRAGERLVQPALSDFIEALGVEGPDLFYRGEAGAMLLDYLGDGGQLQRLDLERYASVERVPLTLDVGDHRLFANPPPAAGGAVVCLALELLDALDARSAPRGSDVSMAQISRALAEVEQARARSDGNTTLLGSASFRAMARDRLAAPGKAMRGTTHISIVDGAGQLFSTTLSNGTGAGCLVPGLGLVPNNMLGESDLVGDGRAVVAARRAAGVDDGSDRGAAPRAWRTVPARPSRSGPAGRAGFEARLPRSCRTSRTTGWSSA